MAADDHYHFYFQKRGSSWGSIDGGRRAGHLSEGLIGRVGLYTMAQPCHGELRNMEGFTVFVPRDSVGSLSSVLDAHVNDIVPGVMGSLLSDHLLQVERRLPELTQSEAVGVSRSILELIRACYVDSPEAREEAAGVLDAARKLRVRRLIQTQLSNPKLSVDSLARDAGMSRSSLYRLFETDDGVAKYIERLRVQKALAALKDPQDMRNLSQVAADCGLGGTRDLSRLFKRQLGCSPKELRRTSRDASEAERTIPPTRAIELALQKSSSV